MASSDRMLSGSIDPRRGYAYFRNSYVPVTELLSTAMRLQAEAQAAKLAGDHNKAVELYRSLLDYVCVLDDLDACDLPSGMPTQLVQRAIELSESRLRS